VADLPISAVPVRTDVRRTVVAGLGTVHRRVETINRLKHVERFRIRVK